MSYHTMEPTPSQIKEENCASDTSSLSVCCSENYDHGCPGLAGPHVWVGHPSDFSLPGAIPHPHHHPQPGMVDPHYTSYRFHCPSEVPNSHCQLPPHPDYLPETQSSQYHFLTGPMPGLPDTSHHSSVSAPWVTNGPLPCGMMPGELHNAVTGICAPELMDNHRFQEGLTEVVTHSITQPVCNVSGGGQVVVVNHCQLGPVLHTLAPPPAHGDMGPTQGQEVSVLVTSNQYHQTACPLYSESRVQSEAAAPQNDGTACESKSRKPCNCTKSQCLKLYCDCFANGEMCSNCNCSNCYNNAEHDIKRHKAIKVCLDRNPEAFRPKIASWKSGEVKGRHNKGCNCKRSACLKFYCECYEANIMCTSSCKCVGCGNYGGSVEGKAGFWDRPATRLDERTHNDKDKSPPSVITPDVVEAVCGCLLAQAEKAGREGCSPALAERVVLEEFGHCLSQIFQSLFESNT